MKKSEMEEHHARYLALEDRICEMANNRDFPAVFSVCEENFAHFVPAAKFRKQQGVNPESPTTACFDVIIRFAPPLFAHSSLESLRGFITSNRLVAKHENDFLQAVEAAIVREEMARQLWGHIEQETGLRQDGIRKLLGVNEEVLVDVIETWEQFGVAFRTLDLGGYCLYLRTRLGDEVDGVCQSCGVRGRGRKDLFLRPIECKRCGTTGYYHIRYVDGKQHFAS